MEVGSLVDPQGGEEACVVDPEGDDQAYHTQGWPDDDYDGGQDWYDNACDDQDFKTKEDPAESIDQVIYIIGR
jgi:hypothetical protein